MRSSLFSLTAIAVVSTLIGCGQVGTGDGYISPARSEVRKDAFGVLEKSNLSVDNVVSNNRYRVQTTFSGVGSHVALIAHGNDGLGLGARVQIQLFQPTKLRIIYGLEGQVMREVVKELKQKSLNFTFEISVFNEQDEVGLEVEETTQGLELLHAHIEEDKAPGKAVGLEYTNDGTRVDAFAIRFNIPEHGHGGTQEKGPVVDSRLHQRIVVKKDASGEITELVDVKLSHRISNNWYRLPMRLPEDGDYVTLYAHCKDVESLAEGVTVRFKRLGRKKLEVTYGLGDNLKTKVHEIDTTLIMPAITIYSEADEVGIDIAENLYGKQLAHGHFHGAAPSTVTYLVRSEETRVIDLEIDRDVPGHDHD